MAGWGGGLIGLLVNAVQSGMKIAELMEDGAGALQGIGAEAYSMALDMCGNEGQVVIIEGMGEGVFEDAVMTSLEEGGGAGDILIDAAAYPDAVGEILEEVGQYIDDEIEEVTGRDTDEDEADDADPGEEDDSDF